MRHATFLVRRVRPSAQAYANIITYSPRQCFSQPRLPTTHGQRLVHSNAAAGDFNSSVSNEHVVDTELREQELKAEHTANADISEESSSPGTSKKDHSWVNAYTGKRIESLGRMDDEATEDYVTFETGAKLLCTWSLGKSETPTVWVPGEVPRVQHLELPTIVPNEAPLDQPSDAWSMGKPHATVEPFFASLAAMNPKANFDSTDVIAHTPVLNLLLAIARGHLNHTPDSHNSLVLHIGLVKNTLIVMRCPAREKGGGAPPSVNAGFKNLITQMTTPNEQQMSSAHYHAVRYEIGPLRCVAIVPVEAAASNVSLVPVPFDEEALGIPTGPGCVKVRCGGRGVAPNAASKIMTREADFSSKKIKRDGSIMLKSGHQAQLWFNRPNNVIQGVLEPPPPGAPEGSRQLVRISVRQVQSLMVHVEDSRQLDFRKLVTLLNHLRNVTRRAGGSCVLVVLPKQKNMETGETKPTSFELHMPGAKVSPIVLDWHVERFWSK